MTKIKLLPVSAENQKSNLFSRIYWKPEWKIRKRVKSKLLITFRYCSQKTVYLSLMEIEKKWTLQLNTVLNYTKSRQFLFQNIAALISLQSYSILQDNLQGHANSGKNLHSAVVFVPETLHEVLSSLMRKAKNNCFTFNFFVLWILCHFLRFQ